MIQRVQSIYFLLALVCVSVVLVFPLFSVNVVSGGTDDTVSATAEFGAYGLIFTSDLQSLQDATFRYQAFENLSDNPESGKYPVYLIFIGLAMLTVVCILMYKNRKRQLAIARLNLILHFLVILTLVVFYYFGTSAVKTTLPLNANLVVSFSLEIGFYFLIASLPFLILANRGIKNDEKLVKSLDRIR
jgi:hypothetical protein